MLIGIDMLGIPSLGSGERAEERLIRLLVASLIARDPVHRYVLYVREGHSSGRVPSGRHVLQVTLPDGIEGRGGPHRGIRRVLDHNPDGLDWLVLLDPSVSGTEAPMTAGPPASGLRVASLVADLGSIRPRDLIHHDAILAFSESTADGLRRRIPAAAGRVVRLPLALDDGWHPPERTEDPTETFAGLGIVGPFVLANLASGPARSNLGGILDAYCLLPDELRAAHQLVIAGAIDDPWAVVAYLHDRHCAEGLVLVGPVDQPTLRTLYGRCAAFVSPCPDQGPPLSLVEAMGCGAAVVAGLDWAQAEVVGDAGLFADPSNPAEIAERIESLLVDPEMARRLGSRARGRTLQWTWGPVVDGFLAALGGEGLGSKVAWRKPSAKDRIPARAIAAGPHIKAH
jgi:glycosyltransferase involved in cell wall biosynthesis